MNFALVTGVTGVLMLASAVNSLSALLAVSNLLVYCAVYTPMKRMSTSNTSLGAVVGAIPPLIGWAAATGTLHIGQYASSHCEVIIGDGQTLMYRLLTHSHAQYSDKSQ